MRFISTFVLCLFSLGLAACGSSDAGTFVLDEEAMAASIRATFEEQYGSGIAPGAETESLKMYRDIRFELVLESNGTYTFGVGPLLNRSEMRGDWSVEGEELLLTITWANGVELDAPSESAMPYTGDTITINEEGMPLPALLKRK